MHTTFTTKPILGQRTGGRKGALEDTGGAEHHNITEAAPNEPKLGEGG